MTFGQTMLSKGINEKKLISVFLDFMDNDMENDLHDYDEVASDDGILEVVSELHIYLE